MSRGRINGCPVNIRNWAIYIQDKTQVNETWLRIKGLNQMTQKSDADNKDGSATTDLWKEPYVTKRHGSLSLEGKPKVDPSTGEVDPGQAMLDDYATSGVCDDDATIKIVDPYGMTVVGDFIVTSKELTSQEDGDTKKWSLEQVGELEILPYVQVSGVAMKNGETAITTLSGVVGGTPTIVKVAFTPTNASNQRFRISNSNKRVATVSNVTDDSFTVTPVSAGTCRIVVTSVNNAMTATLTVTVTES